MLIKKPWKDGKIIRPVLFDPRECERKRLFSVSDNDEEESEKA